MSSSDQDDDRPTSPAPPERGALPKGRLSRGMKLGRALLSSAGRAASNALGGSDAGASAGGALAAALDEMKGLSMKVGQMLSYVDLNAAEGFHAALARLQQNSTPLSAASVERVIEEDLGKPPQALFESWEERPFAAASIGQVHRARLPGGEEVAVKVRYPGIERAVRDDLKNAGLMRGLLALTAPGLDGEALMAELHERFLEECDYRREAENQREFRAFFADTPGMLIPEVHAAYSSERVLTSELVQGRQFQSFAATASQAERDAAARSIHGFAFRSIFGMRALNCDPHPGNYVFTPHGVAFLDFGCVRRFSEDLVHTWRGMLRGALEQDQRAFREAVVRIGLARDASRFDFDAHYSQYLYLIRPWLTADALQLTPEFIRQTYRALLVSNPNRAKLNMPRELLFANRLQWGLYSVLAQLRSGVPLREEILSILYEPHEERPLPFSDRELRRYLAAFSR